MKKTLWSRDFTIITIGTLISAIGGTAMNFAFSLVVFDNTDSTMLTGIFTGLSMIPAILIPIIAAPFVDTCERKKVIVRLDAFNGICYLLFAWYLSNYDFSYTIYLLYALLITSTGSIYQLAYASLYPDLIPKGFMQKGYSISSMIYPSVTALITPIASMIYVHYGVAMICLGEGILLLMASYAEHHIAFQEKELKKMSFSFSGYREEMMEEFHYLKKEKGIRSIYAYMSVTNANAEAVNMMSMALFQSSSVLTTTMYAFLTTAETAGRMLGSIFHYFVRIPDHVRYKIAVSVYASYEAMDMILLFIAYPLMILNRFICGFLGVNSMNIREASTQNYIPSHMRARVNGLFNVLVSLLCMCSRFLAGAMGEFIEYPYVAACFSMIGLLAVGLVIVRNKKHVQPIYNQHL